MAGQQEISACNEVFDLVVVGAGMCGSAAARHAIQLNPELRILLVGPAERSPESVHLGGDQTSHVAAFHSCHEDEGRITRRLDKNEIWATLAARSMDRYASLEKESGIKFHYPVGFMVVADTTLHQDIIQLMSEVAKKVHIDTETVEADEIQSKFPFMDMGNLIDQGLNVASYQPAIRGILEPGAASGGTTGAGYISARKLVSAQQKAFQMRGGLLSDDVVDKVITVVEGNQELQELHTLKRQTIRSKRVLICTNNTTNFKSLLPRQLDLCISTQTTARFILSDGEAEAMKSMPAMVVKLHPSSSSEGYSDEPENLDSCYILPPVYYPFDHAYAVKMGHGKVFEQVLETEDEFLNWHREKQISCKRDDLVEQTEPVKLALVAALGRLLPNINYSQVIFNKCATSNTQHGYPYIDLFSPRERDDSLKLSKIGCCVGCNGYAAKSSDEIGRLAARMMLSELNMEDPSDWSDGIDPASFRAVCL